MITLALVSAMLMIVLVVTSTPKEERGLEFVLLLIVMGTAVIGLGILRFIA